MYRARIGRLNSGYLFAVSSAALFGSISTLAKPAVELVDPLLLAAITSAIAAAFFTPFTIRKKATISANQIKLVVVIAVLGAAIAPSVYFVGLKTTTASDATILANSEIVFTVLIAILIFKERPNRFGYASAALVFIGVFVIATQFDPARLSIDIKNVGNILVILTMLCWALDNNLSKIATSRMSLWRLAQMKSAIGAAALAAVIIAAGTPLSVPGEALPNVILLSILGLAVPMILFYTALKKIGTVRTILIFSTSSVFGIVYASLFLGEQVNALQVAALGIILAGIALLRRS